MSGRKRAVLSIHSDANIRHAVEYHLKKAGFEVCAVESSEDARAAVRERIIDLILCDRRLDKDSGLELRKQLFLDRRTRDIPFLLLTEAGSEDGLALLRFGFDDWLAKPVDPLHVISRVQAMLSRREAHDEMARYDPLTQALNRVSLERQLAGDLARLRRYDRVASIALLDVDGFGQFNKAHGHPQGDLALALLANILHASMRTVDLAGRLGGGRFLLYLPETPVDGAQTLVDRVQEQFAKETKEACHEKLTFCAALAEAPCNGAQFIDLYECLQDALAEAKEAGPGSVAQAEKG